MQCDLSHDSDYSYMQMLYHTDDIHRVYLHCVIFYALEESCQVQRLYHTHYIHRVYLQHVLVHVFKAFSTIITHVCFNPVWVLLCFQRSLYIQRLYHIDYIHRVSLQYVFFHVFGDYCDKQRLYHTDYFYRVFSPTWLLS